MNYQKKMRSVLLDRVRKEGQVCVNAWSDMAALRILEKMEEEGLIVSEPPDSLQRVFRLNGKQGQPAKTAKAETGKMPIPRDHSKRELQKFGVTRHDSAPNENPLFQRRVAPFLVCNVCGERWG
ncbi:MAG: hypothetical protein M3X11_01850, partial [Acidobacteriota bacterium]|nr:hypothetical protein [Acidobacteriota bacterium]